MKSELLAPAGDMLRLKVAFDFGADAVFIGGKSFSLRARASNFTIDDIKEAVSIAHTRNKKLYVTVNIIPHDDDLEGIEHYLATLGTIGVDAVIVASIAIGKIAKHVAPHMEVHISTQVSAANEYALRFYKSLGFDRVVLARECSLADIKALTALDIIPIEVFIHGGMCVNVSGRCTLSNHMSLRDANRGGCAQSCRWRYELRNVETKALVSSPHVTFTMSSKDLNATHHCLDLIQHHVASLKIEGRMKSEYYVATVVNAYRHLIDQGSTHVDVIESTLHELSKAASRETSDGFYQGVPQENAILYGTNGAKVNQDFVGIVKAIDDTYIHIEVRNVFEVNDVLEFFGPHHQNRSHRISEIINHEGNAIPRAFQPMSIVRINRFDPVEINEFIRKGTL